MKRVTVSNTRLEPVHGAKKKLSVLLMVQKQLPAEVRRPDQFQSRRKYHGKNLLVR